MLVISFSCSSDKLLKIDADIMLTLTVRLYFPGPQSVTLIAFLAIGLVELSLHCVLTANN